jgi:hypothetical protein
MLTTAGLRSNTAQINWHMYFCNVVRSITPVEPPTVEQTAACLDYRKSTEDVWSLLLVWWCCDQPSKYTLLQQQMGPSQKISQKWQSSVLADLIGWSVLFWMSFPTRRKSLAIGLDILFFCFLLSKRRVGVVGGAKASGEKSAWGLVMILLFSGNEIELQGRGAWCMWVRSMMPMHIIWNGEGNSRYHVPPTVLS